MSAFVPKSIIWHPRLTRSTFYQSTAVHVSLRYLKVSPSSLPKSTLRALAMSSSNGTQKRPVGRRYVVACDGKYYLVPFQVPYE